MKFCFLDFLNCPSKAFDALTIIILESLSLRFVPLTYQTHFNLKPDQHHRMLLFNINNCPCGYSLGETINLTLVFFTESSNFTNIRRIAVCFVDTCWLREPTIFRRVSYWSANTETKFCNVLDSLCLASNAVPKLSHSSGQSIGRQEPLNCLCEGLLVFLLFVESKSVYSLLVFELIQILNYLNYIYTAFLLFVRKPSLEIR